MSRRPVHQTLSGTLDILGGTAQKTVDLFKALAFLSDKTVRRSAVEPEAIPRKAIVTFLDVISELIIYKFFKDILKTKITLAGQGFLFST